MERVQPTLHLASKCPSKVFVHQGMFSAGNHYTVSTKCQITALIGTVAETARDIPTDEGMPLGILAASNVPVSVVIFSSRGG